MASFIDDDMRQQVELLQSMLLTEETPDTQHQTSYIVHHTSPDTLNRTSYIVHRTSPDTLNQTSNIVHRTSPNTLNRTSYIVNRKSSDIPLISFIERLNTTHTSALTIEMQKLTDTAAIRLPMSINEMAFFIGSTPTQTRLVYGYAPGRKKLSPLEYVHLLTDDLFKRPGLQGLISPEQRILLSNRARLMDLANVNASLSPAELNQLLQAFGITGFTDDQLLAMLAEPVSPVLDTIHSTSYIIHPLIP